MTDRLVLAIDTSFGPVSAALCTLAGEAVAHLEADNPAGAQAETLPPLVARLFQGVAFERLARVAVTVGPGAFTGVRVGLAFAKGLGLATGAKVLGFTTLECLAVQARVSRPIASVIDAKRGEVYVQAFSPELKALCDAQVLLVEEARAQLQRLMKVPCVLTGSGAPLVAFDGADAVAAGRIDTKLLAQRASGAALQNYPATPAYLRAPDARLPQ